jgi:hypothetical protein
MRHRLRAGTILPALLVALALVTLLGMATASSAVQAHREAQLAALGAATLVRAESALEAVRQRLADPGGEHGWPIASLPAPGSVDTLHLPGHGAHPLRVTIARPHPLLLWLTAHASAAPQPGVPPLVRRVERALWLHVPAVTLAAAVTSRAPVQVEAAASLAGDDRDRGMAPCGPPPVPSHLPPLMAPTLLDTDSAAIRVRLARQHRWGLPQLPPLPSGGEWQGLALAPPTTPLGGTHRWRGALVVDGDLTIAGTLEVDGLLLVMGRLAVPGRLIVRGAVAIVARAGGVSRLGRGTDVRFNRCMVQLALATLAVARAEPVGHWASGEP